MRVLRLSPRDDIEAFSAGGQSFRAGINSTHKKHCQLILHEERPRSAPPRYRLELAQALPKGDKLDLVLQKATELGVTHVHLLHTERSDVRLKGERLEKRMQHWKKVVRAATEQSGRRWVPALSAPRTLENFILTSARTTGTRKLIFEPTGAPLPNASRPSHTTLLIGPEGGWSPDEQVFAGNHEFLSVRLGGYILRTETAALAALSAIQQDWGWCNREELSETL